MKQYRRSRPEASKEGVRRAKALLEGDKEAGTGRRVLNSDGGVPVHPLLRRIEIDKLEATLGQSSSDASSKTDGETTVIAQHRKRDEIARKKLSDLKKRQEFLRAMSNFRPKETVFEAFATGGGKDLILSSQVDRCLTKRNDGSAAALTAMKGMRRQMKIARDKGSALVIAGSKTAQLLNGESVEEQNEEETDDRGGDGFDHGDVEDDVELIDEDGKVIKEGATASPGTTTVPINGEGKRRLSKAERKKMKKDPNFKPNPTSEKDMATSTQDDVTTSLALTLKKAKSKRGADFRDSLHFIENDSTSDTVAAARSRRIEAALQPSASSNSKSVTSLAYRIEENMLDIVGDENVDLVKRQRIMRWDKSKRKYVQTTVGDELSGDSKSKKMRLESGQLVKSDKLKLGELYEKWQKKTNRSIGRVGVFDDVAEDADGGVGEFVSKKGQKGSNNNSNRKRTDDVKKTAVTIRKEREEKEKMRIKNMKRADRRKFESKQRAEKAAAEGARKKGYQGKKGTSGRWKGHFKKGGKR